MNSIILINKVAVLLRIAVLLTATTALAVDPPGILNHQGVINANGLPPSQCQEELADKARAASAAGFLSKDQIADLGSILRGLSGFGEGTH